MPLSLVGLLPPPSYRLTALPDPPSRLKKGKGQTLWVTGLTCQRQLLSCRTRTRHFASGWASPAESCTQQH